MKQIQEYQQSVCFLCEQSALSTVSLSVTFFNPQLPLAPYYFSLEKHIKSLLRIQEELERCIYDWPQFFRDFRSLKRNAKVVERSCSLVEEVNRWIIEVRKRRDVLTFSAFVDWFDISDRYRRWRTGAQHQPSDIYLEGDVNSAQRAFVQEKVPYCFELPNRNKVGAVGVGVGMSELDRSVPHTSELDRSVPHTSELDRSVPHTSELDRSVPHRLETEQNLTGSVDKNEKEEKQRELVGLEWMFPFDLFQRRYFKLLPIPAPSKVKYAMRCRISERQVILILEEYSTLARVKSLLRSLINRPKPSGAFTVCSVPPSMNSDSNESDERNERNESDEITVIFRDELDISPRSVHYSEQERMVVIRTDVGLYLYRSAASAFSLVSFVEIRGCLGVALKGDIIFCLVEDGSVCSYCIRSEQKIGHKLRLVEPRCILYTKEYDRLLISGREFVYVARLQNDELVIVRRINTYAFDEMSIMKEYVLGVNYEGCVNVIEMRSNDGIIGVVTSLNVPQSRCGVHLCAQKRNVLLTEYHGSITLIDTIEGPFGCKTIKDHANIVNLWWETNHVVAVLQDGVIASYRVWL